MAERLYTINAPIDQVRSIVTELFTQEGWTVAPFSADTLQITRGKKGMSIAFGALMGDTFYLSQNLQFGTGPRGETLVRYLVDADAVRAAADAVGEALAGLGYRRLALRQALRPVGPSNPNLGHDGPSTLLDVLFGPYDEPYDTPRVTSRFDSAPSGRC